MYAAIADSEEAVQILTSCEATDMHARDSVRLSYERSGNVPGMFAYSLCLSTLSYDRAFQECCLLPLFERMVLPKNVPGMLLAPFV